MYAPCQTHGGRLAAGAILLAAALAAAGCSEPQGRLPDGRRRPDVFLIVVDTLRSDRLTSYGYGLSTTPYLDRLASEGVLFEDVTAQASWTLPSMVSMLTGRYLTESRDYIGDVGPTLAESFQAAGYTTIGIVSNPSLTPDAGFERGFDEYVREGRDPIDLQAVAEQLWPALESEEQAREREDRAPLFLYLHTFDPHAPYYGHPEYLPRLKTEPGQFSHHLGPWQERQLVRFGPPAPGDDPDWREAMKRIAQSRSRYAQEVAYTDDHLERIFDELRARGLLEHAIIALASDHGEGLWDHPSGRPAEDVPGPEDFFYQAHGGHLYQDQLATPLVLWGAGLPAGVRVETPVENIDLYPTLLELADVPRRAELHGHSLVQLLEGPDREGAASDGRPPLERSAVFSNAVHKRIVRELSTDLKLTLLNPTPRARFHEPQLFDLGADPEERRNLYAERPADVERLTALSAAWTKGYADGIDASQRDAEQEAILRQLGYTGEELGERD